MYKNYPTQVNRGHKRQIRNKGFTLVELLVVIAIMTILAGVVFVIIDPSELNKRGRDATRLGDLANLQQAIQVAIQENTAGGPDVLCVGGLGANNTCEGRSNSNPVSAQRPSNGTGWVKVDVSAQGGVSVPVLPVDPINDATYHYTYCSDGTGWEINAQLESVQQLPKMRDDGGPDDAHNDITVSPVTAKYEIGSRRDLITPSPTGAQCGY